MVSCLSIQFEKVHFFFFCTKFNTRHPTPPLFDHIVQIRLAMAVWTQVLKTKSYSDIKTSWVVRRRRHWSRVASWCQGQSPSFRPLCQLPLFARRLVILSFIKSSLFLTTKISPALAFAYFQFLGIMCVVVWWHGPSFQWNGMPPGLSILVISLHHVHAARGEK